MIQSVVVLYLSKCSQFHLLVQFLHVLIQVPSFFDYHHWEIEKDAVHESDCYRWEIKKVVVKLFAKMVYIVYQKAAYPTCILLFEGLQGTNNPCFMLLKILCVVMLASQSLSSRCSSTWHPQCEKPGSGTCSPSKVTHDLKDHIEQQMCLDESVSIAH